MMLPAATVGPSACCYLTWMSTTRGVLALGGWGELSPDSIQAIASVNSTSKIASDITVSGNAPSRGWVVRGCDRGEGCGDVSACAMSVDGSLEVGPLCERWMCEC